jgi:hypothetical protein
MRHFGEIGRILLAIGADEVKSQLLLPLLLPLAHRIVRHVLRHGSSHLTGILCDLSRRIRASLLENMTVLEVEFLRRDANEEWRIQFGD